jgi:hypothetical protein
VIDVGSPDGPQPRPVTTSRPLARGVPALTSLRAGASTGVGSLPHRSAREAAGFALSEYDVPAVPSLPRRSPAEGMIAQALVGIAGIRVVQYGSLAVDPGAIDPFAPVHTDLTDPSFHGMRAFLYAAYEAGYAQPIKWQFVGPVTLGVALVRAGVPDDVAFAVAARAVRSHVAAISVGIATALPQCPQIVLIDEPWFGDLMEPGFPIAPDPAIDMLSGAMASVSGVATVGVHCCATADVASLLAAGPDVLSIPVHARLAGVAGYLDRFLVGGGRVAWGVVPTDGPMFTSTERHWRELTELWGELVRRGADRDLLRATALVTPHCGLGSHTPVVAERVCRVAREIGRRIDESWAKGDHRD